MIRGRDIILFSSDDWSSGLKTSKYHIAVGLAKTNRVLFVNSIGLRTPQVSQNDITRIFKKLAGFARGIKWINNTLFVFTPIVLPLHDNAIARRINTIIMRFSFWHVLSVLHFKDPLVFVFTPNITGILKHLKLKGLVYYCIDELKGYKDVDAARLEEMEISIMEQADCVIACSKLLADKKQIHNPRTYYVPHGVEWDMFRSAINESLPIPADIMHLTRPIIGYFGFLSHDWIDFELLRHIAESHPEWRLVLIGKSRLDLNQILPQKNIHFLGVKAFEDLPSYCRQFSVGIIPFVLNELTLHSNPLKLFEYLSSGLPVVSVDIPEVRMSLGDIQIGHTHNEFVKLIEKVIKDDSPEKRCLRSDAVRNESWSYRLECISDIIDQSMHT